MSGDERDRTSDLGIANAALSQLSYVPKKARRYSEPPCLRGASGDRTRDLLHAMQALSQLSYGPIHVAAGAEGFEPS